MKRIAIITCFFVFFVACNTCLAVGNMDLHHSAGTNTLTFTDHYIGITSAHAFPNGDILLCGNALEKNDDENDLSNVLALAILVDSTGALIQKFTVSDDSRISRFWIIGELSEEILLLRTDKNFYEFDKSNMTLQPAFSMALDGLASDVLIHLTPDGMYSTKILNTQGSIPSITKYCEDSTIEWEKQFEELKNCSLLRCIEIDKNIFFFGLRLDENSSYYYPFVCKMTVHGELVWQYTADSFANGTAYSVSPSIDGSITIVGSVESDDVNGTSPFWGFVVMLDEMGNETWSEPFNSDDSAIPQLTESVPFGNGVLATAGSSSNTILYIDIKNKTSDEIRIKYLAEGFSAQIIADYNKQPIVYGTYSSTGDAKNDSIFILHWDNIETLLEARLDLQGAPPYIIN